MNCWIEESHAPELKERHNLFKESRQYKRIKLLRYLSVMLDCQVRGYLLCMSVFVCVLEWDSFICWINTSQLNIYRSVERNIGHI